MKKSQVIFNALLVPVDFGMLLAAGLITYLFRTEILSSFRPVLFELNLPLDRYFILVLFTSLFFLGAYAISGLYSMNVTRKITEEFFKIIVASSAGIMGVIIFIFLRQELFDSRFLVIGAWLFAIIFVMIGRLLMRFAQRHWMLGIEKVLIIGIDGISGRIKKDIEANPAWGLVVVGELSEPRISGVKTFIGNPGVDQVVLADPNYSSDEVSELVAFCNENHITFKYVPNVHQILTKNFAFDMFTDIPLIELRRTSLYGWGRIMKRIVDIAAAVLALVILSPVFLIVAFAIKWETDGPVFVKLKRISKNRIIDLYKFRSMVRNAERLKHLLLQYNERRDGPLFKLKGDPRVTRVGKFIRRTRMDELPQFWNILKGDISLVGPRPHQPDEIKQYLGHHKNVLAIKAGATGLGQISGSSDLPFEKEVALDTFYIENWSLLLDLKVIVKTALKFFFDKTAV
jgi:exopolysaccharide biosynthesis polyprenyl glycosylphosphotransferase